MARLLNPRMEHVAQLLFTGKSAADASRGAGYPDDGSSFIDNARRRAHRKEVKARVTELQEHAAHAAEIDRTFVLLQLKQLLDANIDDYLDCAGTNGPTLNMKDCTREQIQLLKELACGPKGEFRIRLHDKVAILALLAKTAGLDREQPAQAIMGIGERLAAALKRANESTIQEKCTVPSNRA
jgi:hypothetical protein